MRNSRWRVRRPVIPLVGAGSALTRTFPTAALLRVGSLGSIRSNTMRAFGADEMTTIIGKTG